MGFLIDTNVWSELQKRDKADSGVQQWFESVAALDLHVSVLVIGEVRRGVERLRRRDPDQATRLDGRLERLKAAMGDRILPISTAIAERWARLNVPDPLPAIDSLIAATALEHDLTVVSRNLRDFERTGAKCLNPFSGQSR